MPGDILRGAVNLQLLLGAVDSERFCKQSGTGILPVVRR